MQRICWSKKKYSYNIFSKIWRLTSSYTARARGPKEVVYKDALFDRPDITKSVRLIIRKQVVARYLPIHPVTAPLHSLATFYRRV
jgi:hypothetical protein